MNFEIPYYLCVKVKCVLVYRCIHWIFFKRHAFFRCRKKRQTWCTYFISKPSCTRHNDMVAAQILYVMSQTNARYLPFNMQNFSKNREIQKKCKVLWKLLYWQSKIARKMCFWQLLTWTFVGTFLAACISVHSNKIFINCVFIESIQFQCCIFNKKKNRWSHVTIKSKQLF